MDYAEFHDLTATTVRGLYDRIPTKYHDGFESLINAGELRFVVEDLLTGLKDDRVSITPAEKTNLAKMVAYLEEPASTLDGLIITEAPHS